jgi:hypothetical protein
LDSGQDHAGRAVATLQSVTFPEALLKGMQLAVAREALDGGDFGAIRLHGQQRAGFYGLAIQKHRAGTAQRRLAPDVGAGEFGLIAEKIGEQQAGFDLVLVQHSVDLDFDRTFQGMNAVQVCLLFG